MPSDVATAQDVTDDLVLARRGPSRCGLAVAAVVIIAGVAAAVGYDQWLTHPDAISPGIRMVTDTGPVTVGLTYAENSEVTTSGHLVRIDRVQPIVVKNTAAATVTMELCRHRPGQLSVGTELLSQTARECTSLDPVADQSVRLSEVDTQLVAVVRATRLGAVWVDGYRVSYHQGTRHQTQSSGAAFRWTAH